MTTLNPLEIQQKSPGITEHIAEPAPSYAMPFARTMQRVGGAQGRRDRNRGLAQRPVLRDYRPC
jgi:hypothetical protein